MVLGQTGSLICNMLEKLSVGTTVVGLFLQFQPGTPGESLGRLVNIELIKED